jgi:hypothetical protein
MNNDNELFSDNKITEKEKVILNGRIYPAIKACVNNRYKIVISFFAYYSFILNAEIKFITDFFDIFQLGLGISLLFTFFIILNYINYAFNAWEEQKIEKRIHLKSLFCSSINEFIFGIIMIIVIWLAFCCLHLPITNRTQ